MEEKIKESERFKKSKRKKLFRILEITIVGVILFSLLSCFVYNWVWKDYLAVKEITWSETQEKFGCGWDWMSGLYLGATPETLEELQKIEVVEQRDDVFVIKWKDKTIAPVKFRSPPPSYYVPKVISNAFLKRDVIVQKEIGFDWSIVSVIAMLAINILVMYYVFGRMAQRSTSIFGNKKRKKAQLAEIPSTRFFDVAGIDEVVEEAKQMVDQLRNPEDYEKLGAKMIRGVLFHGPPGCGKTLLARAVAGEAGVSFINRSGSDFVEVIGGLGAKRVRELFEEAKSNAPCIIFIDEIDSVGKTRGSAAVTTGAQEEREQTLNQLCIEMDGLVPRFGIVVMAATNRADLIDPALLRPGRFDRKSLVSLPDLKGREAILKVHTRDKPLAEDVDLSRIAKGTIGFSGADLADLANKAAMQAAELQEERNESQKGKILMKDLESARDQIIMGEGQDKHHLSEEEKRHSAYYEAAKVIVAKSDPFADPVYKVSILPHGFSLGKTQLLAEEERHYISDKHLLARVKMDLAGRAAEEILETEDEYIQRSSRAAEDFRDADQLIMKMICEFAMDKEFAPRIFGKKEEFGYQGSNTGRIHRDFSEDVSEAIDKRKREILLNYLEEDKRILKEKRDLWSKLAEKLIVEEELEAEEIDKILGK